MDVHHPQNVAELCDFITAASQPLSVLGGGTRPIGQSSARCGLSTDLMSGIMTYEPGAMTLVAKSGTSVAEIEAALDLKNQCLAFEPMDHRDLLGTQGIPTLGGIIAANVSGPRRIQVGAARDFTLGVSFVDGAGQFLKNGGRVMKNVTGYDLVKLLAGSWGTLGVLTEVSLKVLPKAETEATLRITTQGWEKAVECMSAVLRTPYDVSGVGTVLNVNGGKDVMIRIEGFVASVRYRVSQLTQKLVHFGDITEIESPWRELRNLTAWKSMDTVWRVSLRPTDSLKLLKVLEASDIKLQYQMDWGGGLIWLGLDSENKQGAENTATLHAIIQEQLTALGGHATLMKSASLTDMLVPSFQPQTPTLNKLMVDLRHKFDPRGILNPGRMY